MGSSLVKYLWSSSAAQKSTTHYQNNNTTSSYINNGVEENQSIDIERVREIGSILRMIGDEINLYGPLLISNNNNQRRRSNSQSGG